MADTNQSELCSANWHCSKICFLCLLCPSFHWPHPNRKEWALSPSQPTDRELSNATPRGQRGDSLGGIPSRLWGVRAWALYLYLYGLCAGLLLRTSMDWDSGMAVKINVDWAKTLTENLTWASRRSSMLSLVLNLSNRLIAKFWPGSVRVCILPRTRTSCGIYSWVILTLWSGQWIPWGRCDSQRSSGMIICRCPPFIRLSLFADILKVIHFIVRDVALEDAKILLSLCWV